MRCERLRAPLPFADTQLQRGYDGRMKTEPPPKVPGNTPWDRLDNSVRTVLSVPKDAVLKKEAAHKQARQKKHSRAKVTA